MFEENKNPTIKKWYFNSFEKHQTEAQLDHGVVLLDVKEFANKKTNEVYGYECKELGFISSYLVGDTKEECLRKALLSKLDIIGHQQKLAMEIYNQLYDIS